MVLGVWDTSNGFDVVDSLVVSLIAILIVFFVLALLILITWLIQKGMDKVDSVTSIMPKEENKILSEDKDAVAALLAATIDFNKETGKDAKVVSIKKIED